MSFLNKIFIKYKWKFFWIFRNTKTAFKYKNNVNLLHRIYFCEIINKLDVDSILEIGCGNGANIWLLQQNTSNNHIRYYGVDQSSAAIEVANNRVYRFPGNVYFEKNEGLDFLLITSISFDIILFDAVLMYLTESEVSKILKRASICSKYLFIHELSSKCRQSELNSNGFIHNYDKILEEIPNAIVIKNKSKRVENIWGQYGHTFFIKFS